MSAAVSLPSPERMQVLGSRVDGLTLRFRVSLDPLFVEALHARARVAHQHGRAGFHWRVRVPEGMAATGPRDVPRVGGLRARFADETNGATEDKQGLWGELKFSRDMKKWLITNQPFFRLCVDLNAPGAQERVDDVTGERTREGGWTVELVFYAQWLADVGLDVALREAEAIASLCGDVHEQRLGRIDLCADIQGWAIGEDDVSRLVKRPRARWQKEYGDVGVGKDGELARLTPKRAGRPTKVEREEEIRAQDFGRGALGKRTITGLSVGRGGAMMTRIYDKRAELERSDDRRLNEEARWTAAGWDGVTRVTRVEFQIRGSVIAELGIRDPMRAQEVEWGLSERTGRPCILAHHDAIDADGCVLGLVDWLDWIWRTCLEWVKLVELEYTKTGKLRPIASLEDDARWALLRTVQFHAARAPHPIRRFRVRAAASSAMSLGVALSQAARDGRLLEELPENTGAYDEATAEAVLRERVGALMARAAGNIVEMLIERGGVLEASAHYAIRHNAALYRFKERAPPEEEGSIRAVA